MGEYYAHACCDDHDDSALLTSTIPTIPTTALLCPPGEHAVYHRYLLPYVNLLLPSDHQASMEWIIKPKATQWPARVDTCT